MSMKSLVVLVALVTACTPVGGQRYTRKEAQKSLKRLETPGLVVGEFKITKVTDGDTVRVDGLDSSLRLLGMDAEETIKNEQDRRAIEADFAQYLKDKAAKTNRPVKVATPMGEEAKHYAQDWFKDVTTVRIERDHPAEIRDRYNRYLAYVFAQKNGTWVCYNIEAVRAGMSPYFPKYGYSRRFHNEFVAAQDEARNNKRGIWAPGVAGTKGYPDYPAREAWWNARGAFVESFRNEGKDKPNYIDLTHWDAMKRLEEYVGKEVVVLSTVDDVRVGERGPSRVNLGYRMFEAFPLIFFDRDVLGTTGLSDWRGEYVTVTGIPTFYENKHTHKKQLQIQVDRASQIKLSKVPMLPDPATLSKTAGQ